MSETTGTIIKLLAALTSPKACVKYITVAAVLFISWKYLEPFISTTKISKEQLSIIILFLGVGVGSLIGQGVSWGACTIWSKYELRKNTALNLKQKKEAADKKRIEKERSDSLLLAKIQKSFEHLHFEQKGTLRKLTLQNEKLDISDSGNSALDKNGYIQLLVHVMGTDYLAQINPIISKFIKDQWVEEVELKVKEFLENNEYAKVLLELLDENNQEAEFPVSKEVLKSTFAYSQCIRGDVDEGENSEGYWIWFEDYMLDEFEKQTGKTFVDETFIPQERIIEHEAKA